MKKIYISHKLGCLYWIENGALMYSPLPQNGLVSFEDVDGGEVEFNIFEGEQTAEGEDITTLVRDIEKELLK